MIKYEPSFWDTIRDENGELECSKWFYGSSYCDEFLFKDPKSLPRFGHLARKALMHYLGDHYNPHQSPISNEPFIRLLIKGMIEYRIEHKTIGYDWDYIDNFLKQVISDLYGVPLKYDLSRIKQGILPPYRGIEHHLEINTSDVQH